MFQLSGDECSPSCILPTARRSLRRGESNLPEPRLTGVLRRSRAAWQGLPRVSLARERSCCDARLFWWEARPRQSLLSSKLPEVKEQNQWIENNAARRLRRSLLTCALLSVAGWVAEGAFVFLFLPDFCLQFLYRRDWKNFTLTFRFFKSRLWKTFKTAISCIKD